MFQRVGIWIVLMAFMTSRASAADPNAFLVWSSPSLPGRLHVPDGYSSASKYPLILFLHGGGERGLDNVSQVNGNIDNLLAGSNLQGAFLYAPQSAGGVWGTTA